MAKYWQNHLSIWSHCGPDANPVHFFLVPFSCSNVQQSISLHLFFGLSISSDLKDEKNKKGYKTSVTRLGDFWHSLAITFLTKESQIIDNFWGYFESLTHMWKLHWLLFGQLLEKLGYFLLQHLVTLDLQHFLFFWSKNCRRNEISVTRFGEIPPFWQNLKSLGQYFEVS